MGPSHHNMGLMGHGGLAENPSDEQIREQQIAMDAAELDGDGVEDEDDFFN